MRMATDKVYMQTDRAAVVHNNLVFILFISFATKFSFAFVFKKKKPFN